MQGVPGNILLPCGRLHIAPASPLLYSSAKDIPRHWWYQMWYSVQQRVEGVCYDSLIRVWMMVALSEDDRPIANP